MRPGGILDELRSIRLDSRYPRILILRFRTPAIRMLLVTKNYVDYDIHEYIQDGGHPVRRDVGMDEVRRTRRT